MLLLVSLLHRQLSEAGGHVVMAVRNPKAANDLIKKWQEDWSGKGLPLNIEVPNEYTELMVGNKVMMNLKTYRICWYFHFCGMESACGIQLAIDAFGDMQILYCFCLSIFMIPELGCLSLHWLGHSCF